MTDPASDSPSGESAKGGFGAIRLLFLTALLDALVDVGKRIDPLLREHGMFRSQLETPYDVVPLHRYVALVEAASSKFQRPYLGLEMGKAFVLTELGPFYALLRASGILPAATMRPGAASMTFASMPFLTPIEPSFFRNTI